jgi:DNA/pantothenate metabolism flavoprotein
MQSGQPLPLSLKLVVDILGTVAGRKKPPFFVGFAAETPQRLPNS